MLPTLSSLPAFAPGTVPAIAASVLPTVGGEPAVAVGLPEIGGLDAVSGDQPAAPDAAAITPAVALPARFSAALASAIDLAAPVISAPAPIEAAPAPGNPSPPAGNELPVTRRAVTLFALPLPASAGEPVEAARSARLPSDTPQDAREDQPDQPTPTLPGLFAVVAPIQPPRDLPAPVAASSPAPDGQTAPATPTPSSATKAAEPMLTIPRSAAPVLPAGLELAPADPAPQLIAAEAVVRIAAPAAANLVRPLAVKGTRSVETTVVAPAPTRADPIEPFTFRAQPEAARPDAVQQPMPAPSFGLPDSGVSTSPAIAAAPARPTDFATLVEAISRARDEVAPRMVAVSLAHADFGRVSLRFRDDGDALSVSMSSADPGFARAVHAAPAPEPLPAVAPKDAAPQDTEARRDGSPASGGQAGNGSTSQNGNAPASRQPARAASAQRGGDTAKADQSDIFA